MAIDVNDFLDTVTPEQRKWVIERTCTRTDKAAADAVGVSPVTVCRWKNKKQLDWAVQELLKSPQDHALEILTQAVVDAARAKMEGLRYTDKEGRLRWSQSVATEILNRILGQPIQRSEHAGPGGGPITLETVAVVREKLQRKLIQETDDEAEDSSPEETDG